MSNKYRPPQARLGNRPSGDSYAPPAAQPGTTSVPRREATSFARPATPRGELLGSTGDDANVLRPYFKSFNTMMEPEIHQRNLQQSTSGGGVQQIFIAELAVPNSYGPPIPMSAEGTSKKNARQAVFRKIKEDLDSRGWLGDIPKAGGKGGDRSRKARPTPPAGSQRSRFDSGNDQWDQTSIRPIPRASNAPQTAHVPSAWDDDVPAPPAPTRPRQAFNNGDRDNWDNSRIKPIPRQQQQQQNHLPREPVPSAWDDDVPDVVPQRNAAPPFRNATPTYAPPLPHGAYYSPGPAMDPYSQHYQAGGQGSWFSDAGSFQGHNAYNGHQPYQNNSAFERPSGAQFNSRDHRSNARTIPPPNATLPTGIDEVERKFVEFYCKTHNIAMPHAKQMEVAGVKAQKAPRGKSRRSDRNAGRKNVVMGREAGWDVELRLAAHKYEGQDIDELVVVGTDKAKKTASYKALTNLCGHLLAIVDQNFVDIFKVNLTPVKQRIKDMLANPVMINLTEASILRLDNMLGQLRDAEAFDFREPDIVIDDTLGLGSHRLGAPPLTKTSAERLHPADVVIPRELENNQLPIFTQYREIISAIENNPVTVLSAETGAGKTTQLPQFLLAHLKQQRAKSSSYGPAANIVITQPRRIAAISVAQRVASERGETIGKDSAIGYQVRFDDKRPMAHPEDGHAVFCTSGILLKRFQEDPQLKRVTHIILDEVHERDLNTDLLLIIVRQLIQRRPDIRVVLMSATAETELFQNYFRGFGTIGPQRLPPIIQVAGRMFPVQQFFLEDVNRLLASPRALPVRFQPARESMHWVHNETGPMIAPRGEDPLPYDYLEALIAHISVTRDDGAILCFLPGWQEIDTLMQRLKDDDRYRVGFRDEGRFRIYPLHSSIPTGAQQLVFDTPPPGVRKIILSTNIAETSVTINDVVYVIDAGKTRTNSYDADRRISSLSSVWASLSNLRQRSGRAGRCQPGMYFSLLSHRRKETVPYSMPPELLRVDLQATVLKIKSLRLAKHVGDVFAAAPQPPSPGNVINAINELRALGALDERENLTTLGQVLSTMPVDPWIGKMVLEAATLGCLDPILTIAGGMEIGRGIFAIHPEEKDRGRAHILSRFAVGTDSDHLTLLNAFRAWKKVYDDGGGARGFNPAARDFARANFLHHNSLANVERSRQQLFRILEDCGLVAKKRGFGFGNESANEMMGGADLNAFAHNHAMIRAILTGALYPNIAEVVGKDEYATRHDYKLRLTSSSVNSWKGVVASAAPNVASGRATPAAGSTTGASDLGDYDYIPDDDSVAADLPLMVATAPPLPPRLLSFQEKQRVDGGLYLRNTTRTDAAALFLFADSAMVQTAWRDQKPELVVDGWIHIGVPSAQHVRVLLEMRAWLEAYVKWALWSRQQKGYSADKVKDATETTQKWDQLGKMLIREIAGIVEDAEETAA